MEVIQFILLIDYFPGNIVLWTLQELWMNEMYSPKDNWEIMAKGPVMSTEYV